MKNLTTNHDITIREAMKKLSEAGQKCLVIINEKNLLLGTLSDGDLRKAILSGAQMNDSVIGFYQSKPTLIMKDDFNIDDTKKLFIKNKFDLIPIVDKKNKLVDILLWENIIDKSKLNYNHKLDVPVVIMAGGKGTRMEPFTKILPKPLIPINEKPIIEHIIERFAIFGCSNFYISVNYKARILKAYFDEIQPNYDVEFIDENEPLGTAGSLELLKGKIDRPFFVTNCDIIVKSDYASLFEFHQRNNYGMTLVASATEYVIPYGTCELENDGSLSKVNEKPKYDFLVNTGLYVINPELLNIIPNKKFYHITHLIEDAKKKGFRVGVFPVDEDVWVDVGQWTEYQKAVI